MPETESSTAIMNWPTFGLTSAEKHDLFLGEMRRLTQWHKSSCAPYRAIVDKFDFPSASPDSIDNLEDVPFLPVRLFKRQRLISVPDDDVIKTMTSSGTSGQSPSQIFLDKFTSSLQVKVLARIMADFIGPKRLPMLVIDCKATVSDRHRFSARTAGVLGFSMFGRNVAYALNDDMSLDVDGVQQFLDKYAGQDILVFGFTFIAWQHLILELENRKLTLPLENGILIHGGGWKQLLSQAVEPDQFKQRVFQSTAIKRIHNYYGMVEQTGSIFMECDHGHLHASAWSDILIRDPIDFSPLPDGQSGLIQLCSVIPHSYPGHALLSEDLGRILGHDDCPCGRKGAYLEFEGRLEQAEIRGCSDTYTQ